MFSIEIAQALFDSTEQFPVSLDDAWQWLGYSRKDSAKDMLIRNFDIDIDYQIKEELSEMWKFLKPSFVDEETHLAMVKNIVDSQNKQNIIVKKSEKHFTAALAKLLNGKTEVITPSGKIDVLTDDCLIEVKNVNGWKSAIGQILAYSRHINKPRKVLFLTDDVGRDLHEIEMSCSELNIELWLYSEYEPQLIPIFDMSSKKLELCHINKVVNLTIDCFQAFAMMTDTKLGQHIETCFTRCCKTSKQTINYLIKREHVKAYLNGQSDRKAMLKPIYPSNLEYLQAYKQGYDDFPQLPPGQ